tara:strand:- start:724 stop:996 length:273 start_codon:yes stop_codon:yes gene_type:complete
MKILLKIKNWFINIQWFIKEVGKIYSTENSYFSKKRIESGIAFVIGQWGMVYFLLQNINVMSSSDLAIWAGIQFAIAGYLVNHIQKEKTK